MSNSGNIEAMEATLEMHRQESLKGERVWEQVSVKDMSRPRTISASDLSYP